MTNDSGSRYVSKGFAGVTIRRGDGKGEPVLAGRTQAMTDRDAVERAAEQLAYGDKTQARDVALDREDVRVLIALATRTPPPASEPSEAMVERVAKALFLHEWRGQPGVKGEWKSSEAYWADAARAAIAALRAQSTKSSHTGGSDE